ncbi:MAG: 2-oxoacid:ferredoxin oxidoreductase subunit beta [Thermoplasmata archaeon]|nr:2-oxoacid:ferredoxin oxidoreductase subunit beta [Euryarchaeota archaeon]MVT36272.1 2-oxoacid:ferredoxin oxidoreductase subunit beta [Euryarchaeota archaeon]
MVNINLYDRDTPTWCPGCGDYGVLTALKRAASNLGLDPTKTVLVTGIGCSSKINSYFYSYGIHTIHGRAAAVATGIKLSNPELEVIIAGGDGDAYAIGTEHLVHIARRNLDVAYIVMNNQIYGLTKGQVSPTSDEGFITITTPYGSYEKPVNGPLLALASGATFVARGFSGDPLQLSNIIEEAIKHKGFALVDVLSPCVTWNKINTYDWYKENSYQLKDHDPTDKKKAFEILLDEKFALGIIYKKEEKTFEEKVFRKFVHSPLKPIDVDLSIEKIYDEFR